MHCKLLSKNKLFSMFNLDGFLVPFSPTRDRLFELQHLFWRLRVHLHSLQALLLGPLGPGSLVVLHAVKKTVIMIISERKNPRDNPKLNGDGSVWGLNTLATFTQDPHIHYINIGILVSQHQRLSSKQEKVKPSIRFPPVRHHTIFLLREAQGLGSFSSLLCTATQLAVEQHRLFLRRQRFSVFGLKLRRRQLQGTFQLSN